MLASFTSAFSITVVDSILVTRTHGQSLDFAASLQSFCWGLQVCFRPLVSGKVLLILMQVEGCKARAYCTSGGNACLQSASF